MYAVAVTTYCTRNCYLAYSRSHGEFPSIYIRGSGVRGISGYVTGGYVGSH